MKENYSGESDHIQIGPIFETEIKTFEAMLPELLKTNRGEWALIKETELGGVFPQEETAIKAGYEKYGNTLFFTRQILEEQPQHFYNSAQAA